MKIERNSIANYGFAVAVIVLGGVAWLSYSNTSSMIASDEWEMHSQVEMRELGELFSTLQEIEAMSRGFVIIGNEEYLERYGDNLALIERKLTRLRDLADDNAPQVKRLEGLSPLIREKLALVGETIDARRRGGFEAAVRVVTTGRGKTLMDEIRSRVTEAQNDEGRLLQEREAREHAETKRVLRSLLLGDLLSLALLCTVFLLLKKEITRSVAAENELREHRDKLEALVAERTLQLEESKVAAEAADFAKSEFLENMSHEMRTPLTGISGVIDYLLVECHDEVHSRYITMAKTSAEALKTLMNDIIEFSRVATGEVGFRKGRFDLRSCVRSAADIFSLEADRKGLTFILQIEKGVPETVVSDEGRLRQVLVNLLGNAVKFTARGEIELTIKPFYDHAGAGLGFILFSVRDSGVGISEEYIKSIFERFAQGDSSSTKRFGGVGLGLAFSRQIIENLGGEMWVESRLGEGSTFSFTLPINGKD